MAVSSNSPTQPGGFRAYHSVAYEDTGNDQYGDHPGTLNTPRVCYIRGDKTVAQPFDDYRVQCTAELLETRLASFNGTFELIQGVGTTAATFSGYVVFDYELFSAAIPPNPTTLADVNTYTVSHVQFLRTKMPLAKIGVWGLPTSPVNEAGGAVQYGQDSYTAIWDEVDFMEPHIYTAARSYTAGFVSTSTTRINEALEVGLPVRASIHPHVVSQDEFDNDFWADDDVKQAFELARDLGCFGATYWDNKGFAEPELGDPAYFTAWGTQNDAILLMDQNVYAGEGPQLQAQGLS